MDNNGYISIEEMRKRIDNDFQTYVKRVNYISLNTKTINDFDKLTLRRYLKCRLVNFLQVNGSNVDQFEEHSIDNLDFVDFDTLQIRYIELANLFKSERNWLKVNSVPKKEKISFYSNGLHKLKYTHVKNNSKNLIIVFQSSWANISQIHNAKNKITELDYDSLFMHDRYQFFGYLKTNKEYDYIFLQDDFSHIYGWFLFNYGWKIDNLVTDFIKKLSYVYDRIDVVGASKGGYGAYHICKSLDVINSIILIAPILSIKEYQNNVHNNRLIEELTFNYPYNLNYIDEIESKQNMVKKVFCVTGKSDYQYQTIIDTSIENNIFVNISNEEYVHHDIIINEYKMMFSKYLDIN